MVILQTTALASSPPAPIPKLLGITSMRTNYYINLLFILQANKKRSYSTKLKNQEVKIRAHEGLLLLTTEKRISPLRGLQSCAHIRSQKINGAPCGHNDCMSLCSRKNNGALFEDYSLTLTYVRRKLMERKTRFELATLALARRCSTTEPLPLMIWCLGADLNHRHADFQSAALPTELPRLTF